MPDLFIYFAMFRFHSAPTICVCEGTWDRQVMKDAASNGVNTINRLLLILLHSGFNIVMKRGRILPAWILVAKRSANFAAVTLGVVIARSSL